jgi:hypothetical protein
MRYTDFAPDQSPAQPEMAALTLLTPHQRELVAAKKLDLDNKHLGVKLKRCRKGIPLNPRWDQNWKAYKRIALKRFIANLVGGDQAMQRSPST